MNDKKFIVKKSPIQGRGVFAIKDIKNGELICFMRGKQTNMKAFERMYAGGDKRAGCDPFQVGLKSYLSLSNPYNYFNHSCNPNAGIQGRNKLIARRSIKKMEEITYDCSATEWTPQDYPPYYGSEWPMACHCGDSLCRRKVACFFYLPKSTQRKYVKSGIIQDYIIEKLTWPKSEQRCPVCEAELGKTYLKRIG